MIELAVLLAAGLLASLAALPYVLALFAEGHPGPAALESRVANSTFLQTSLMLLIALPLGLWLARELGLARYSPPNRWLPALVIGLAVGAAALILDRALFAAAIPMELRQRLAGMALWKRWLVCLYGGINEEILTRLFGFSLFAWLLVQLAPGMAACPYWLANLLAALSFGLAHLPATAALEALTRASILRGLLLNGLGGLVFGYLFWRWGLLAAMLAHFAADMVIQLMTFPKQRA